MIDFTPAGFSAKGNVLYEMNPGGVPTNVAVTTCLLGGTAGFLGTVSNDHFGQFLHTAIQNYGVDTRGLRFTNESQVKMAFVTLNETRNRSFFFTKGSHAETIYRESDIDELLLDECKVLLSTVSQYKEPSNQPAKNTGECQA